MFFLMDVNTWLVYLASIGVFFFFDSETFKFRKYF